MKAQGQPIPSADRVAGNKRSGPSAVRWNRLPAPPLEPLPTARVRLQQTGNTVERPLDALNFFLADVRDVVGAGYSAAFCFWRQWLRQAWDCSLP
jgi:hypothetical protein